jgi:hypothetical protein
MRTALKTAEATRAGAAPQPAVTRLAFSKREAAAALGISVDHLERHIWPELRVVRSGRRTFVPVCELDAWLDRSAERTLPNDGLI